MLQKTSSDSFVVQLELLAEEACLYVSITVCSAIKGTVKHQLFDGPILISTYTVDKFGVGIGRLNDLMLTASDRATKCSSAAASCTNISKHKLL